MNQFLKKIKSYFHTDSMASGDPVYTFFTGGENSSKRRIYNKVLRSADVDQRKILTEYQRRVVG